MRTSDDFLIGYLAHIVWQQRAYYGGILVTNSRGVPREFRHSEAIKPSKLQFTLYGDSLESSLGSDALAPALYDSLSNKPDILLVDKGSRNIFGHFAQMHRPAALILSSSEPEAELGVNYLSPEELNSLEQKEYALKGSMTEQVYAYIVEDASQPLVSRALELAQKRMNLLSPFDRVRNVLSEIAQAEQGRTR